MSAAVSVLAFWLAADPRAVPAARAAGRIVGRTGVASTRNTVRAARPSARQPPYFRSASAFLSADASAVEEAPPPAPDDRDRARILRLQSGLRDIVHLGFNRFKVGLRVIEANSGRVFFGRGTGTLMDPASNQKVLATTTALVRLGSDWSYRTEVYGEPPDAEGVVAGDLFLRGNGDPTLGIRDLDELTSQLVTRGVTRVLGGVVADPRRFGDETPPSGASSANDEAPSQLVVNRGIVGVRVRPAEVGEPPLVILDSALVDPMGAPLPGFVITNRARTAEGRSRRLSVEVSAVNGVLRIDVAGRIGAGNAGVLYRRSVADEALAAAILLRAALGAAGISVREPASVGTLATTGGERTRLARHASEPLGLLLRKINKDSDNYEAEHLLEAVGAEAQGGAPTTEKGIAVLREVIGEFGLDPRSYVPRNGSGLGHANRITAQAMTELLRAIYLDPRVGPELLQSLSVGGVDGTTRNRFRGSEVARQVRAKTGTLSGKSCLSGLVGDGDDVMAFSIMVEGFRTRGALSAVRGAQVAAVNTMMRYMHERDGAHAHFPSPRSRDRAPSGTDYETAGEVLAEAELGDDDSAAAGLPVSSRTELDAGLRTSGDFDPGEAMEREAGASFAAHGRLAIGAAGSFADGDTAPGARVSVDIGGDGLGLETTFYGTTFHALAGPGAGSSEWTRLVGMVGPRYRFHGETLSLDLDAALALGWFWVQGHDYVTDSTSRTWAVGGSVGAHVSWNLASITPWLGLDAIAWPGNHAIAVMGISETRELPPLDLLLSLGASFPLW